MWTCNLPPFGVEATPHHRRLNHNPTTRFLAPFHPTISLSIPKPSTSTSTFRPKISCAEKSGDDRSAPTRTCRNCKNQYDPSLNHPAACRYHTAHFGGETKRKFESVHTGGTMSTPESGKVLQYWHCCGSEDPFHQGCTAAPHCSYDD